MAGGTTTGGRSEMGSTQRQMVGTSATSEGTIVKSEKEKATQQGAEELTTERSPFENPSHYLLGGQRRAALLYGHWIYDHCKNVAVEETVSRKRQIEKEGGGPALAR